ncbi:hypothetical protein B4U79_02541 [Dinothrombium tinctorium]|uniref:RRM domain-containing protein n=1 Tax=Dinothrombium tinctorium TaxID=1965070 RepID=A0A3S3PKF7_9ACAR|nr:hypothetical protein B4U79_02541 [Dinothrombium tinctorium]
MHHPLQVKPADSENRNGKQSIKRNNKFFHSRRKRFLTNFSSLSLSLSRIERKLFIGMLSKKYGEVEVRQMFSVYGNIEECTILKDANGQSKGCAFVTYTSRTSAVNAIKAMNHALTLEGCSSPLVVKFADSQKEKEARKQQQMLVHQLWTALASPTLTQTVAAANPYLAFAAAAANAAQQQQQQQQQFAAAAATLALQQQFAPFTSTQDPFAFSALTTNPVLAALTATSGSAPASVSSTALNAANNLYGNQVFANKSSASLSPLSSLSTTPQVTKATTNARSQIPKQLEGPDGANLFIYHLPAEYTDADLVELFSSFGNVLSSRVFIDKQTNLSKCFGFVSFDNPLSAQAAIQAMNGFQISNKRLKVQLKKVKEKPY